MLIDLHSHLLPNVDDGSRSIAESVEMAAAMVSAGFGIMSCTSHFWEGFRNVSRESVPKMVAALQQQLMDAGLQLQIVGGAEIGLREDLVRLALREIPSYNMAGRWYLVDTWQQTLPDWLFDNLKHLQSEGGGVIFAHPERCEALIDDPPVIDRLAEAGCLFQLNYYTLVGPITPRQALAERYLNEGRYSVAASDLHQPSGLTVRADGRARLKELLALSGQAALYDQYMSLMPRRVLEESGVSMDSAATA